MMRHNPLVLLHDLVLAGQRIIELTEGHDFVHYEDDWVMRAAVERQFEIIGEALRRLLALDDSIAEKLTDAPKIIAFRNQVAHGYDTIANSVVWGIIERYLPRLMEEAQSLLPPDP